MYENERHNEARKMKEEQFKGEIKRYDQLQDNLTKLQREEREALIMWKKAMESWTILHCFFFTLFVLFNFNLLYAIISSVYLQLW